jgi:16S rRNA (cytosine967-C5)-methyltransferase
VSARNTQPHRSALRDAARPTARRIAVQVISRVLRESAFASAVLNASLGRFPELDPRERALATELVYGTLRTAGYLDERLEAAAPRGLRKLDDAVRAELWVAAYQILLLERIPNFAAVSEAVEHLRSLRGDRVAGFGNALLRRMCDARGERDASTDVAVRAAAPWLRSALGRTLGTDGARAFLTAPVPPPIGLRVRSTEDRTAWIERWTEQAGSEARFEIGKVSPHAVLAWNAGEPTRLPGYDDGVFAVQEEGAQVVALAVGAREGERVLDACAGRGNKSGLLAGIPGVTVDAADLYPAKLDQLGQELRRLGCRVGQSFAVDWSVGPGLVPSDYDRVLVDAPCSGTGTLRRRPELALMRRHVDLGELSALQTQITAQAASRLRVGGVLVYAVCSVLREEAEEVVERLVHADAPALEPHVLPSGPVGGLASGATAFRLLPHVHGTDGYFVAALRRVR